MFKDKFKVYKLTIISCIFMTITTGISYIAFGYWFSAVAAILAFLATAINIACFLYEKKIDHK